MSLPTKAVEYLRRVFTEDERLQMGSELASGHSRLASIKEEQEVVNANFKERKAAIAQTIATLSRNLENGWTMENIECQLVYGQPNELEVTYIRLDTGEIAKVRPLTKDERQEELPLVPVPEPVAQASAEQSRTNVAEFFAERESEVIIIDGPSEDAGLGPRPSEQFDTPWSKNSRESPIAATELPQDEAEGPMVSDELFDAAEDAPEAADPIESEPATAAQPDDYFAQAARIIIETQKVSAAILQRDLGIGYMGAVALLDQLEASGVISPADEHGHRSVLMTKESLDEAIAHPDAVMEVIAPKIRKSGPADLAAYHREHVAKETPKAKPMRKSGFVAQEPEIPSEW